MQSYHNIKLLNDTSLPTNVNWDGATAMVTVQNGVAIAATITEGGSGYTNGEQLYFDSSDVDTGGIGGAASGYVVTTTNNISVATGNYVQVTGITTGTDSYHRISSVTKDDAITLHKHSSDVISVGQQVIDMGPVVSVASASGAEVTEFDTTTAHGLLVGNSFRVLNGSDQNLGDFIVKTVVDVNTFTATTSSALSNQSPTYILKHGLSSNEAASNVGEENLGVRGLSIYDHDYLISNQLITKTSNTIQVLLPNGDTTDQNILQRF